MHPQITRSLAHERQRQLIDEAQQARAAAPRRRTRRALLAAALTAAAAAFALPAAAQAAIVDQASDGSLRFRGEGGEADIVSVRSDGGAVEIQDLAGVTSRTSLCAQLSDRRVRCAIGVPLNEVLLGSGNDLIAVAVSNRVVVEGGFGNDGLDGGKTAGPSRVTFHGGADSDFVSYSTTDRAVRVSGTSFDGRIGLDEDVIALDVERIVGSRFGDQLTSFKNNNVRGILSGGLGDDVLTGNSTTAGAMTTFDMGPRADGGDRIVPGTGVNVVDYSQRTLPVNVTIGSGSFNDGEAGERDQIPNAAADFGLDVVGGAAGDTLRVAPGARFAHGLHGNGGSDTLEGSEGGDFIVGGLGSDTILAGGGNDQVRANDGVSDVISCGAGFEDTADLDSRDGHSSCENRIGRLRLTPKTVRAAAGKPVHLRLSWRHPQSWRKLRAIELRLLSQAGVELGEVTIRPRAERISDRGAVQVMRKRSRLTRKGKTVTARLALRLDKALVGQSLMAEVQATDTRGRRQLQREAGTVRVAG